MARKRHAPSPISSMLFQDGADRFWAETRRDVIDSVVDVVVRRTVVEEGGEGRNGPTLCNVNERLEHTAVGNTRNATDGSVARVARDKRMFFASRGSA